MTTDLSPVTRPATDLARVDDAPPLRDQLAAGWLIAQRSPATREAYRRDIAQWFEWCDRWGIATLAARRVHVDAYDRWMESGEAGRKYADSTRSRKLSAVSSFYDYAMQEAEDDVTRNPAAVVKRPPSSPSDTPWLTVDQLQQLFAAADASGPWDAALVRILYYCGVRVTELCTATTADLRMVDGVQTIAVIRKGRKRQRLPIPETAAIALRRHLAGRSGPLFTHGGRQVDRHQVAYAVARIASAAGLETVGLTPHGLRHSAATHLFQQGEKADRVQEMLGHARIETTMGYAHHATPLSEAPTHRLAALIEPNASEDSSMRGTS